MKKIELQLLLILIALVNTVIIFLIVNGIIADIKIWEFVIIEVLITIGHFAYNKIKTSILLNYFNNQ
jgi:hypothetical protein